MALRRVDFPQPDAYGHDDRIFRQIKGHPIQCLDVSAVGRWEDDTGFANLKHKFLRIGGLGRTRIEHSRAPSSLTPWEGRSVR
jgi:hypothetical protein